MEERWIDGEGRGAGAPGSADERHPACTALLLVLRRLFAAGRAAHPDIELEFGVFARHATEAVTRRLERSQGGVGAGRLEEALALACGEGLFLAIACDDGVAGAWERFVATCGPLARAIAAERGASAAEAEDIAAAVLGDACAPPARGGKRTRLGTYEGAGSLAAWLRAVVVRRLIDMRRAANASPGGSLRRGTETASARALVATTGDPLRPEVINEVQTSLGAALDAAWTKLTTRERLVLVLRFREELKQQDIARLLGIGEPRVSRLVGSGVARIRDAVNEAFAGGEHPLRSSDAEATWRALAEEVERWMATRAVSSDLLRGEPRSRP